MVRLVSAEGLDEATLHKYEMGFFSEETRAVLRQERGRQKGCVLTGLGTIASFGFLFSVTRL